MRKRGHSPGGPHSVKLMENRKGYLRGLIKNSLVLKKFTFNKPSFAPVNNKLMVVSDISGHFEIIELTILTLETSRNCCVIIVELMPSGWSLMRIKNRVELIRGPGRHLL